MAAATAAALPAMLQPAGLLAVTSSGGEARDPSKRYKKYELIGQGAQKKVYRAFDEERGIEVAWNEVAVAELARFREKDQQRVFAEIRVLKQLKHKNIMTLFDYWFDAPRFMLVFITEIFPDGTLRQYRRRHKLADLPAIKRWAWQILQGLVYLHGHNPPIIHRDLKCDNIFVNGTSGVVKIGDLGLVTLCRDFSAPQSVLGTPEFMAPELYEEKYDEKVDVYAFGMCLLELATMEYPYSECKNAAQIYKKVTQGILPGSVDKLTSTELYDFVKLCLCHDPRQRPEARQLLKHPFFEAIRAAPNPSISNSGASGTPPRLLSVTSTSLRRTESSDSAGTAVAGAAEGLSSPLLTRSTSVSGTPGGFSGAFAAAAASDCSVVQDATSPVRLIGSIAAAAGTGGGGGSGGSTGPCPLSPQLGSIAAAAGGLPPTPPSAVGGSALSSRAGSLDLVRQRTPPGGSIAAALSCQPLLTGGLARMDSLETASERTSTGGMGGAVSPLPSPPPLSPTADRPEAASAASLIAAAAAASTTGASYSRGPPSTPGSIALSLSPSPSGLLAATAGASSLAATITNSSPCSPGLSLGVTPSPSQPAAYVCSLASGPGVGLSAGPSPAGSLGAAAQAAPSGFGVGSRQGPQEGQSIGQSSLAAAVALAAAVKAAAAAGPEGSAGDPAGRPSLPIGVSSSAAAIAAAAVNAAAAAVASGPLSNGFAAMALPSIHEDHELNEDVMFDHDENGRHGSFCEEDDSASYDGTDCDEGDGVGDAAAASGAPGGRSQPVSLQVRSSGQAAANMALSFAMSFTNQRGVRKKVGFQYDLLHDTASAIAVEMVENLSLNTAEAEAIAAMIQHEVSRFNRQPPQQQQQPDQQQDP